MSRQIERHDLSELGSGVGKGTGQNPQRLAAVCGERLKPNEPLGRHLSFQLGGPADYFVAADSIELLQAVIAAAREDGLPWLVLGRGSNVLVSDRGVRGLVVRIQASQQRIDEDGAVYAEAGARLANLAVATATRGLAGLEWGVGVPGSIGGAVVMNAGAHGGCIQDSLVTATVLRSDGQVVTIPNAELGFGYRHSRFHEPDGKPDVVLAADFRLRREDPAATLERLRSYRKHRQDTQPTDPGAGSIFKNPPGTASGYLIDRAGLKGTRIGGAVVSPKHGNFIVNDGGATAADVLALMRLVQAEVERQFGIRLVREVELVGDWDATDLP